MDFASVLNQLLNDRDITAYKINKDTGISQTAIGKWRKGEQYPTADKLRLLANYLSVTTDYLLTGEDPSRTNSATNIQNSNIVQGNHASDIVVTNGSNNGQPLTEEENELLRIYHAVNLKKKNAILSYAYKVEEQD